MCTLSHSIVLVDLNEFPPLFQKVQHSNSRHQKTTSNLRINLKVILKFNEIWPLEGAMDITLRYNFWGHPENFSFMQLSQKLKVSDNNKKMHRAFRTRTTPQTKPIKENFHFHHFPKLYMLNHMLRDFQNAYTCQLSLF